MCCLDFPFLILTLFLLLTVQGSKLFLLWHFIPFKEVQIYVSVLSAFEANHAYILSFIFHPPVCLILLLLTELLLCLHPGLLSV